MLTDDKGALVPDPHPEVSTDDPAFAIRAAAAALTYPWVQDAIKGGYRKHWSAVQWRASQGAPVRGAELAGMRRGEISRRRRGR